MVKKYRKYRWTLRHYLAIVSVGTLLWSFLLASSIVMGGMKIFYKGDSTHNVISVIVCLICIIAMIIDGFTMWLGAKHLTRPLLQVSETVKQVAEGNFKVKVKRREINNIRYEYSNEIDELAKNVNKMAEELNNMDYMRKDFMSNVSHEIKTPIAAITGFTEILLDEKVSDAERQEYLEVINKESMRISRLCENMLSMSRLDSQVLVTKKEKIRLDEQIRKCTILLAEKWSNYDINFEIDLEKIEILSDGDMLQQVWINLIDNAIKYSGKDCTIKIYAKELDDDIVEIAIIDNGIGVERSKIDKIFEKFYQCEESHKKNGNGLGLSIVKRILELLEGTIECASKEGFGTTMIVRLKNSNI